MRVLIPFLVVLLAFPVHLAASETPRSRAFLDRAYSGGKKVSSRVFAGSTTQNLRQVCRREAREDRDQCLEGWEGYPEPTRSDGQRTCRQNYEIAVAFCDTLPRGSSGGSSRGGSASSTVVDDDFDFWMWMLMMGGVVLLLASLPEEDDES